MKRMIVLFIFLLMPALAWAESPWKFISPMPMGRYAHGATLGLDGKIYVMGGIAFRLTEKRLMWLDESHGIHSNLVYDPKLDAWKYLNPVPGMRQAIRKIPVIGKQQKSAGIEIQSPDRKNPGPCGLRIP